MGYDGLSVEEFVRTLAANDVTQVIDVRELALSRKRGFSKTALAHALARRSIAYVNLRELGSPRALRKRLRQDRDYGAFFRDFRLHLRTAPAGEAFARAASIAGERTSALVCYERDMRMCHRKVLVELMRKRGFFPIELRAEAP